MLNDPTVTRPSPCCATPPLPPPPLPLRSAATTCTKSASLRMWMWSCSTHHCPVGWSPPPPYRHSPRQLRTIHIHVRPPAMLSCELFSAHVHLQSMAATIGIACDCHILLSLCCLGYHGPPSPTPSAKSGYRESPLMQRRRLERKFRT